MQQRRRRRRRITVAAEMPETTIVSLGYSIGGVVVMGVFLLCGTLTAGRLFPRFPHLPLLPHLYLYYIIYHTRHQLVLLFNRNLGTGIPPPPSLTPPGVCLRMAKSSRRKEGGRRQPKKLYPSIQPPLPPPSSNSLRRRVERRSIFFFFHAKAKHHHQSQLRMRVATVRGKDGKVHPARQKIQEEKEEKSVSPTRNRTLISGRRPSPALLFFSYICGRVAWLGTSAPPPRGINIRRQKQERARSVWQRCDIIIIKSKPYIYISLLDVVFFSDDYYIIIQRLGQRARPFRCRRHSAHHVILLWSVSSGRHTHCVYYYHRPPSLAASVQPPQTSTGNRGSKRERNKSKLDPFPRSV